MLATSYVAPHGKREHVVVALSMAVEQDAIPPARCPALQHPARMVDHRQARMIVTRDANALREIEPGDVSMQSLGNRWRDERFLRLVPLRRRTDGVG